MITKLPVIFAVFVVLASFGCESDEKSSSSQTPQQAPKEADQAASAVKPTSDQASPEPKADRPRSKAFADTPTKKLGTLPDGVGLPVGSEVPELAATDAEGNQVELQELLKAGDVLLMFYRGGWCPYCNYQVRTLTEAFPEFEKRDITPVLVSVDQVSEAAKTKASYDIPFPVLSDPDLEWHEAFKVINQLDDTAVEKLKGYKMDIEAHSGKKHHKVAVPSVFLITQEGKVAFAHADHDYKVRPRAESLLRALDQARD